MLDAWAVPEVTIAGRRASPWRVAAGLGLVVGTAVLPASAARAGVPLPEALALVPLLLGIDLGYAWIRRRVTRRETWVLYEHLGLTMAGLVGLCRLSGLPALATLDAFWPPLCALMAFGRCGCTMVGCCHGVPASFGIRYPPSAGPWAKGERRVPVQLAEACVWGLLGISGFLALGHGAPGIGVAGGLAAYAVARTAFEGWRADRRTHLAGVPIGRWASGVALATSVTLAAAAGQPPGLLVVAGAVVAFGLAMTIPRWLDENPAAVARGDHAPPEQHPAPTDEEALDAFAAHLLRTRPARPEIRAVGPIRIGAHHQDGAWAISLAGPSLGPEDAETRLAAFAAHLGERLSTPPVRTGAGLWFAVAGEPPVSSPVAPAPGPAGDPGAVVEPSYFHPFGSG
jgi:hypothetical protein